MKMVVANLAAYVLLAGCGGSDQGGLTADENAELNNAAEMLDAAPEALGDVNASGLDTSVANGTAAEQ
jgi:hypothetical protein